MNLNDQYKADMAAQPSALDMLSIVSDFARGQVLAYRLSRVSDRGDCDSAVDPDDDKSGLEPAPEPSDADVEKIIAESCEDCGQHVPSEGHSQRCIERAAERERDEADHWEAGREARLRDKELFGRGIF